jgi:tetratricopeptide (TPR) repeat protein
MNGSEIQAEIQAEVQPLLRAGIAATKAGQTERARQALMRVIELDETNVQAWLWLSAVVDDPTDKFTCLHNVLTLDPDNKPAKVGLARLEQQAASPEPKSKEQSEKSSPPSPPKQSSTKKPAHLQEHASTAGALLQDSLAARRPPPEPEAKVPEEASSTARRPAHLQEHASMAAALIQKKSTARDVSPAEPEPETTETQPMPQQGLGALCPFCRRPISAMSSRCDHCDLPLVVDCPACGTRLDVELTACSQCGHSLGNFRHKTVYFARLAAAYQERNQYRKAIDTWQLVEMLNPNYPGLRLRLAEAQAAAGRPNMAIATLRQVLAEDPAQEAASLVLGKIFHDLSYWDEVEAVYKEALTVSPESAELHFALGWLLMEQGQLKEAFTYIYRATQLDPEHGMAWFRLGQLYEASRKPKLAAKAYRQAVVLLPENKLAHKKAQQLAGVLDPDLPKVLATGWSELVRQATGPILICVLTALLDSGLRPWWIPWTGWLALFLGILGTLLWVSGIDLPHNPAICYLVGERGLTSSEARISAALFGGFLWLLAMALILYPLGQSYPEIPTWIQS